MVILSICGFQGAGKDTFANYLVKTHGFIKLSFAEATKDVLAIMFGWERKLLEGDTIESRQFRELEDKWWASKLGIPGLTPRKVLQMVGTDLFRKHFDDNIWVLIVEKKIISILNLNPQANIIISDARFPNEIAMIRGQGGKLINVQRNLPEWFEEYKSGTNCEQTNTLHPSETSWIREPVDYILSNKTDSIEQFEQSINIFLRDNLGLEKQTLEKQTLEKQTLEKQTLEKQTQGSYLEEKFGLVKFSNINKKKLHWVESNLLNLIEYHRGFEQFDPIKPDQYYLYTGRGPSQGTLHIGHLLGLELVKSISTELDSKIFFMIADDEKILRDSISLSEMESNVSETITQLNKIGFTDTNTTFHINSKNIGPSEYQIMIQLMGLITVEELGNIFGKKDNIGEYFYVFYQMMPCFLNRDSQCIVICGVDQDPFFRLARNFAKKLGFKPPIVLYTKNVPGLDGSEKMSTSVPLSNPIFLSDNPETIKNKIFSIKKVGAGTLDELFEFGANLESDTLIQLIRLFESEPMMINLIERAYTQGFNCEVQEDTIELEILKKIFPKKGLFTRNTKTMITTFGVRCYLSGLIQRVCSKY
jgi:tryptophanyl-tRNA synthetase